MSLKVIELNDSAIRVADAGGLLASSPGFAMIGTKGLTLGEAAEKQAHLHPTQSVNKFWQQLSLEPLTHSMGEVRHFADLAYGHLLHLAELTPLESDVILAVPGNFTAHQLSIILGLTRQCPFNTVGVVDAALAGVIGKAREAVVIHVDVQLHQVLLTRFVQQGEVLQRDSVIQIPGVGVQNFADQIMQLATNQFIQQCRFNPQHNAESEQLLYNELPQLLRQSREQASSLLMTLKTASRQYEAKLPTESLVRKLDSLYRKIAQQLQVLSGDDHCQVLVAERLGEYPGFLAALGTQDKLDLVTVDELSSNCLALQEQLRSEGENFRVVTGLPYQQDAPSTTPARAQAPSADLAPPTHVLYEHCALPLGKVEINNHPSPNGSTVAAGKINLSIKGLPDYLGQIERSGEQVYIICGEAGATLNNERIAGRRQLALGDRLRFGERGQELSLILVRDEST